MGNNSSVVSGNLALALHRSFPRDLLLSTMIFSAPNEVRFVRMAGRAKRDDDDDTADISQVLKHEQSSRSPDDKDRKKIR